MSQRSSSLEQFQLDNGLTVILAPRHTAAVVAVQAWVGVGSADESADNAGIAHVFEHMLFKGTERRGIGQIAREIEAAGGEINAWTSFHDTVFHVVLASRDLDIGLDVLADALQHSSFDPGELEREREVVVEEILQSRDNPMRNVAQLLLSTSITEHPYRRPVIGDTESVRALTRARMLAFYRRWYVANNITLVLSGDFDARAVKRRVRRYFGDMRTGIIRRKRRREPEQHEPRAAVITQDVRESYLALGFPMPPLASPELAALDAAAIVLGQGESSRLFRRVHHELELVTSVYAHAQPLRERGLFVISATARPDNTLDAVEAMAEEALGAGSSAISAREVDKAKRALEADIIYQQETVQGMARAYGYYHVNTGDAEFETRYLESVRRLRPDDVRRALLSHLRPERATIAVLVPPARAGHGRGKVAARGLITRVRKAERRLARAGTSASPQATKPARGPARARVAQARVADDLVREVLDNGMRVLVKRDPSVPVVAMRASWPGGLRLETESVNGVSHLLSRLIVRGCDSMSADDIVARLDEMAGSLAGLSGRNSFGLRAEWLAENWESGLDLLARCILTPTFPPEELERETRRVLDELSVRNDSPSFVAFRLFAETLYRQHPYRMDVAGTEQAIAGLTPRKLAAFYRRHYPVSGLSLVIVGDVEPELVLARVRELFASQPRRAAVARKPPAERFDGRPESAREAYRWLERNQAHLIVGFPGTTVDSPDRIALEVLATVLGGQGGRLFVELRDRQALAYQVSALSVEGVDPGYFGVYISCSPDKLPAAVTGVRRELEAVIDQPIAEHELERAKRYLIGTHEIALQRRSAVAAALAFHEAYGLGHEEIDRYSAQVQAISTADVQRIAAAYLDWDRAITATVKPFEASPEAERRARGVKKRAKKSPSRSSKKRARERAPQKPSPKKPTPKNARPKKSGTGSRSDGNR